MASNPRCKYCGQELRQFQEHTCPPGTLQINPTSPVKAMTPPTPLQAARETLRPFAELAKAYPERGNFHFQKDYYKAAEALALIDAELAKGGDANASSTGISRPKDDATRAGVTTGPSPTAEIDTVFWRTYIERSSVNTRNFITLPASSALKFCDEIDRLHANLTALQKAIEQDDTAIRKTARTEALEEAAQEVELRCAPDGLGQILGGYIRALASGGGSFDNATTALKENQND